MPWSYPNKIPDILKNKPADIQKKAIEIGNETLQRTGSEESAIFSMQSYVKRQQAKESQQKALDTPKKVPQHLQAILHKAIKPEEPEEPSNGFKRLPISKEFLGDNALPVGVDRNLVSAEFDKNDRLVMLFDTGEKIQTRSVTQVLQNHISVHGGMSSQGSSSLTGKFFTVVDTVADQAVLIQHNLGLIDPDAFVINFVLNSQGVSVDFQSVDANSIQITTALSLNDLKVSIISAL